MNGAFPTAWRILPSQWGSCSDFITSRFETRANGALLTMRGKPHPEEPSEARRLEGMSCTSPSMTKTFRTLDDVDVKGKRVLLRVDLNVPMENGRATDATRLERVAPTITEISDKGGKVILLAHFGRPKGRDAKDSLKPVAAALAEVIKKGVAVADDSMGEVAAKAVAAMKDGDILCLENTRFHAGEEKNDPAFVTELA